MRSTFPRPLLLVLTLLVLVGAIAAIELRLGSASLDSAQVENSQLAGQKKNDSNIATRANEPKMKEQSDRATEPSGAADGQGMAAQAEDPSRATDAQMASEKADTEEMAARISRKKSDYPGAKEIMNPTGFINTDGVSVEGARGKKVILLDFWTYSCYNCQNTQPYLNDWQDKYADKGLLIIGVHTPEFGFERDYSNVEQAVREANIEYPVVLDNSYATWNAYGQHYWPAMYLIDADGFIRYKHFGEGSYDETESKIRELLAEKDGNRAQK